MDTVPSGYPIDFFCFSCKNFYTSVDINFAALTIRPQRQMLRDLKMKKAHFSSVTTTMAIMKLLLKDQYLAMMHRLFPTTFCKRQQKTKQVYLHSESTIKIQDLLCILIIIMSFYISLKVKSIIFFY